jgi:hypothetical protein
MMEGAIAKVLKYIKIVHVLGDGEIHRVSLRAVVTNKAILSELKTAKNRSYKANVSHRRSKHVSLNLEAG